MIPRLHLKIVARFREVFGHKGDTKLYFSPGRVTIIGELIDYSGGDTITAAVDRGTYIVARKRPDNKINIYAHSFKAKKSFTLDELENNKEDEWAVYFKGVYSVLIENGYAVSTRPEEASADPDFVKRAMPFKLNPFDVDGDDVLKVLYTVAKAREMVLSGAGPCLIVEHTYRISGHSRSDVNSYRSTEEIETHIKNDPIKRYTDYLISNGFFGAEELEAVKRSAEEEVKAAVSYALSRPDADMGAEELERLVYSDDHDRRAL